MENEYNFFLKNHPIKIVDILLKHNKSDIDLNLYRNRINFLNFRHKDNENIITFYSSNNISIVANVLLPIKGNYRFLSFEKKSKVLYLHTEVFDMLDILKNNIETKEQISELAKYSKEKLFEKTKVSIKLEELKILLRNKKLSKI
jgi:hypothetical protein